MRKIDSVIEKSAPYVELLTRLDELEEHLTNLLKKRKRLRILFLNWSL